MGWRGGKRHEGPGFGFFLARWRHAGSRTGSRRLYSLSLSSPHLPVRDRQGGQVLHAPAQQGRGQTRVGGGGRGRRRGGASRHRRRRTAAAAAALGLAAPAVRDDGRDGRIVGGGPGLLKGLQSLHGYARRGGVGRGHGRGGGRARAAASHAGAPPAAPPAAARRPGRGGRGGGDGGRRQAAGGVAGGAEHRGGVEDACVGAKRTTARRRESGERGERPGGRPIAFIHSPGACVPLVRARHPLLSTHEPLLPAYPRRTPCVCACRGVPERERGCAREREVHSGFAPLSLSLPPHTTIEKTWPAWKP